MTPDQFFAKFALFADTPNAVAKMRELILDLAVKGRLMTCPRNSTTVNADFSLSKLKDISVKITDGTHKTPHYVESGVPFVSVKDFSGGKLDLSDTRFITKDEHTLLFRRCDPRRGDILLGRIGTLGKAVVVDVDIEFSLFVSAALIRPRLDVLDSDFLRFALNSPFVTDQFNHIKVGGATHTNKLNLGDLGGIQIPLPPLAEQKRIVAKVDELMALCDQLESQQKQRETEKATLVQAALTRFTDAPTPANLELLFHKSYAIDPAVIKQIILDLAVQGRLVCQRQGDGPAAEEFPKLVSHSIDSTSPDYPEHWLKVPLGKIGEWRGGGTPSKERSDFWQGDIPWVSPKDMKMLHISDAIDHISYAAVHGSSVKMIPVGSLLMVVRGMILAKTFPVAITHRPVTINQDMKALTPMYDSVAEFVLIVLRALGPRVLNVTERSTHGTCKLETDVLHQFVIGIPPLAEQKRIVAKVEELMALVDKLEAQLAASRDAGAKLIEAVVAELARAA